MQSSKTYTSSTNKCSWRIKSRSKWTHHLSRPNKSSGCLASHFRPLSTTESRSKRALTGCLCHLGSRPSRLNLNQCSRQFWRTKTPVPSWSKRLRRIVRTSWKRKSSFSIPPSAWLSKSQSRIKRSTSSSTSWLSTGSLLWTQKIH